MSIFFVGGIHGVGKSSLSNLLAKPLNAEHLIASELIKYVPDPGDPTGKTVSNIAQNQDRLVAELKRRLVPGVDVILDGHFCLLTKEHHIARIPLATFRAIHPAALLLVEAPSRQTQSQLEHREGRPYDSALLLDLAKEERTHAQFVSSSLAVPLKIWRPDLGVEDALQFIQSCR